VLQSTAIQKVINEGGIVIGKTSQDAFGFGGFNLNVGVDMKVPKNPFDTTRVCGGSSGGSAGFTQKFEFPHISIAESTGGSIVDPASFCGVYGLSPTYGLVSRYGLIDYANSLDKIGVMGKDSKDVQLGLNVIEGYDSKDQTSVEEKRSKEKEVKTIGVIKGFSKLDEEVQESFMFSVKKLGAKAKEVKLPFVEKYGLAAYYTIALAEASTNLARYCGMRYGAQENVTGNYDSYFTSIRNKYFNAESKRRLIIGTFVRQAGYRDAYYLKAQQVRTKIIQEYKNAFKKFDILISPTMPTVAPKISEANNLSPLQAYMMDQLIVGPNIAGLPHYNIPIGTSDKLPIGLMAVADHLNEEKLFTFESEINR
jgi:aspartyl-tRNA(Asn)/glutamyl-tRNA(Gln) amidotransferase subunit A